MKWIVMITVVVLAGFMLAPFAVSASRTLADQWRKYWNEETHSTED